MTYLDETLAAALELARAARWPRALSLLDAATGDPGRLALTAAEVALESDWFAGSALAGDRLATADRLCTPSWDLDFLHLRHDYLLRLRPSGTPEFGPAGKDPAALALVRDQAASLAGRAPDEIRHGWARMYQGLILDNLYADREAAPAHYAAALKAGESGRRRGTDAPPAGTETPDTSGPTTGDAPGTNAAPPGDTHGAAPTGVSGTGDPLLAREALRHLGDHDRDRGDLATAQARWERATSLGARAGLVTGTLSQQLLLAVLCRDTGDEPGAHRLATEIARWCDAIGAPALQGQAESFLAGLPVA